MIERKVIHLSAIIDTLMKIGLWQGFTYSDVEGSSSLSNSIELLFKLCKFTLNGLNQLLPAQILSFINGTAKNQKQIFIRNIRLFPISFPAKDKETMQFSHSKIESTNQTNDAKIVKYQSYSNEEKMATIDELQKLRDKLCCLRDSISEYALNQSVHVV